MGVFIDPAGKRYGRFTVLKVCGSRSANGSVMWQCRCACGTALTMDSNTLRRKRTKSCGCLNRELSRKRCAILGRKNTTHGHAVHGKESPEYRAWTAMKSRCTDSGVPCWELYGGHGVRCCTRWLKSFEAFLRDLGPRPEGRSLDRINSNGHYVPSNCRWSVWKTQNDPKRKHRASERVIPFIDVK
jgi:hypothetical protein